MDVHRSGRFTSPRHGFAFVLLAAIALQGGCTGRASLQLTDLNFKRLDPGSPLTVEVHPSVGAWSIEGDEIHIALGSGRIGAESGDRMMLSFVLDGIPTGNERVYLVERRALRGYWHHGRDHERFASLHGVVSVELLPGGRLSGRFKILGRKQVFHVLTNWTTVGQTLLMGTFTADRDADLASSILVQTEKGGMDRGSKGNTIGNGVPQPQQVVGPDVN